MNEFSTLEEIKNLFQKVNGLGNSNCFFYSISNMQSLHEIGVLAGLKAVENNRSWSGYLVNETEKGIGLIPLTNSKLSISIKPENMNVELEKFMFIPKEKIEYIKIKRLNLISPVAKSVKIKPIDDVEYSLIVKNKEKNIPYHEQNFATFVSIHK